MTKQNVDFIRQALEDNTVDFKVGTSALPYRFAYMVMKHAGLHITTDWSSADQRKYVKFLRYILITDFA